MSTAVDYGVWICYHFTSVPYPTSKEREMRYMPHPQGKFGLRPPDVVRETIQVCQRVVWAKKCRTTERKFRAVTKKLLYVFENGSSEYERNNAIDDFCFAIALIDPNLESCTWRLRQMYK